MNRTLVGRAAFSVVLAVTVPAAAQTRAECVAGLIQARLGAQKPLRLSAENVSLTGDTLRLAGRAKIWFDATTVQADEIVINQSSKRVEIKALRRSSTANPGLPTALYFPISASSSSTSFGRPGVRISAPVGVTRMVSSIRTWSC